VGIVMNERHEMMLVHDCGCIYGLDGLLRHVCYEHRKPNRLYPGDPPTEIVFVGDIDWTDDSELTEVRE
jgi:hypothetical protein